MRPSTTSRGRSLASLALGLLLGLAALGCGQATAGARWGKDYFPDVVVTDQDGQQHRFYDDLVKGKLVVFSFAYTTCTSTCPLTTARLAEVQDLLGDALGRDVFMYTVTIDPANDTPEVLKTYAEAFQAKPGWRFLTGRPEDIDLLRYKLGERSRTKTEHQNEVVIGNDRTGQWARDSAFQELHRLVRTIREMDPDWIEQPQVASTSNEAAGKVVLLPEQPGQVLFAKMCAACHTVGRGDRVGPDLKGVAERRPRDWLLKFISNPEAMRQAKDPFAVALAAKYRGAPMPVLGVARPDAEDLIAYLEAMSRPAAQ